MPTNFPTNPDTYTTKVDGVDTVMAAHINDLQDATTAIEQALLGVIPDGNVQYVKKAASSTDNAIPRFDGTDGKKLQNSGVTIDDSNNIKVGTAPVPTSVTSSTDNAIVRFDGTDGKKLQNSGVIINDNGQLSGNGLDGWIYDTDTWTYVNATSFKITGKDVRDRFPKGTKIKLVQSSIPKYFYVTAADYTSGNTIITITGGSDYALANENISGQAYSYADAPQNYPFGTVAIRVERSTDQSIPNATWTALSFDAIITEEKPATTSQWSSGSPTRLTCRLPGYYLVNAHVRIAANATGARGINLMKNGVGVTATIIAAFSEQDPNIQCSAIVKLDTGDYVESYCYQNSGAALNVVSTSHNLYLEWIRLGI